MSHYPGKELEAMSFAVNYHQWIIDEIEPYLGATIAEVGAGIGSVSRLLLAKPIQHLLAFEPSQNLYPLLEQELQSDQRATAIQDFFHPDFFKTQTLPINLDAVAYINVLEHIQDDRTELENAWAALKPQGYLLIFVPALNWLYSDLDRQMGHVRRYTQRSLIAQVRSAGFQIVKAHYFDLLGIIPWYIYFVLLRNSMGSGSVSLYDRLIVPIMRRVEHLVPPPIGKNILLIAQKPPSINP